MENVTVAECETALHLGFVGSPSRHRKCSADSGPLLWKLITGTAVFIAPVRQTHIYARSDITVQNRKRHTDQM